MHIVIRHYIQYRNRWSIESFLFISIKKSSDCIIYLYAHIKLARTGVNDKFEADKRERIFFLLYTHAK